MYSKYIYLFLYLASQDRQNVLVPKGEVVIVKCARVNKGECNYRLNQGLHYNRPWLNRANVLYKLPYSLFTLVDYRSLLTRLEILIETFSVSKIQ